MGTIRITKQFSFETGHALYGYDGKCRNVHGHSYKLYVTVIGQPISDTTHVKLGMVIDFSDLKVIVKNKIVDMPIAKVIKLKSFILLKSTEIISIKLCPEELTPSMCFN